MADDLIAAHNTYPEIKEFFRSPAAEFVKACHLAEAAAGPRKSSLRFLITSFSNSQTTDKRDMVYGLLALSAPEDITPDYSKSIPELYFDVLKASIWKHPVEWSGRDHYLVSFSQLFQRVLGDPYWDKTLRTFVGSRTALPDIYNVNDVVVVKGILAKRMIWGAAESHTSTKDSQDLQRLTAFKRGQPPSVVSQTFLPYAYYNATQGGSALLLNVCGEGDYLCFFKDCEVAAVVRLKGGSGGTYTVIGRAIMERTPHVDFKYWTTGCDVEMSLETLQMLTM